MYIIGEIGDGEIFGLGRTVDEAWEDLMQWGEYDERPTDIMRPVPASPELVHLIRTRSATHYRTVRGVAVPRPL